MPSAVRPDALALRVGGGSPDAEGIVFHGVLQALDDERALVAYLLGGLDFLVEVGLRLLGEEKLGVIRARLCPVEE